MGFANMKASLALYYYSLVLLLFTTSAQLALPGNETDFQALLDFKAKITHDPYRVVTSLWNDTAHFCQWQGVTCGHRHQRVTKLVLMSLQLEGSLPPSIGNLSFLRALDLEHNKFSHEIPQEIGRLQRLEGLYLANNSFTGKIPTNLSNCSKLGYMLLNRNQLEGDIPQELGDVKNLRSLFLGVNNLTGRIPHSFGNLSHLQFLSLNYNNLTGTIPYSLGRLVNLSVLAMASNKLSGLIPSSLFNFSFLQTFDIGANYIQGNLPPDMGNSLPRLKYISVGQNNLTGHFPPSFSNATNLVDLGMAENQISGNLPSLEKLAALGWVSLSNNYLGSGDIDGLSFLYSLTNCTALTLLEINGNNFGGILPEIVSNFSTNLTFLTISDNLISGNIPSGIEKFINLQVLDVSRTLLSGFIPGGIGKLQNLGILFASGTKLSGHLPPSLGNLTNLIQLSMDGNYFEGSIPSSLGTCENLISLNLSHNNLTNAIPPQLLRLSSLSIYLDLSNNHLTENLPMEIGNLKSLGTLDLSGNKLSGMIPSSLGDCISLEALRMDSNNLQGTIPSSLSFLRAIQVLDLSQNNLSGEVPKFLSDLKLLRHLNLSYNHFEGLVPTEGVFSNVSATSLEGNVNLCGGVPEFHMPSCFTNHKKGRLSLALILVIGVLSGLLGVSLLLSVLFLFYLRKRKTKEPTTFFSEETLALSYQMLHKATDGFSPANVIGAGSFGSVFKGAIDEERTQIAVKVFNLVQHGASKSFLAECEALRNIRHRNLVKVLTVCSGIDYNGNDFKALVYKYMVNGSLDRWLHTSDVESASSKLNILQRLDIAVDVAHAIEYLHHHCETPIIHCDLKPSNILLDEELTGHVGDFGLARFYAGSSYNANQSSTVGIRGTIGYAPPEYGMGNEVSTSGDVYSYGVLLLEIFTGKRPVDERFNEEFSLHDYVQNALPEQVLKVLDPTLLHEAEEEMSLKREGKESVRTMKCLVSIFEIGVACSVEAPRERMRIADVTAELVSIRNELLKN